MKRENLYSIVVFNDYEVKKAVEWLSKKLQKFSTSLELSFPKIATMPKLKMNASIVVLLQSSNT